MSTRAETGLLHAYVLDGKGGGTRLDWDGVRRWTPDAGVLWLNLDYSAADSTKWLAEESTIDPFVLEALLDQDPRPRAVAYDPELMLIIRGINQNAGAEPEDMISLRSWIEPRRAITMRHRLSRSLESLAADVARGKGPADTADLIVQLADRVVDHVAMRVDSLGDAIAALEDQVLTETRGGDLRSRIADHRRRAIALRRFLAPQRDALGKLAQIQLPWFDERHRDRVADVADRMARTVEELDAARDRASVTQEELASRLTEMTNQRLYVLSLITAVFLPLGFVCSLLGVNVGGIPFRDDDWAFWALIGLFGIGVGIQLYLFKRRGWL
ncbi:MAG TPA: zinc transporter ZntB [Kofleriaceae bacterium]|nr:zinc transporter ZntB [Kofleriaceae bacterium]